MREEAQVGQTRAPATLDVASPDGRERWRVRGAIVEHTQDDGRSWEIRSLAGGATALAGASPARGVCWLVGPAGTVLLTTDGSRWTRVSAPAVIDLVLVEARDARTATVTARDGRRFTTSDGGVTWRP